MQLHISFLYFAPGATKYVKFYIKSRFSMYVLPHSNESCLLDMKSLSCELYAAFVGYFLVKNFCGKGGHFLPYQSVYSVVPIAFGTNGYFSNGKRLVLNESLLFPGRSELPRQFS